MSITQKTITTATALNNNNRTYAWGTDVLVQGYTAKNVLTDVTRSTTDGLGILGGKQDGQIDRLSDGTSEKMVTSFRDVAGNAATVTGVFKVTLGRMFAAENGVTGNNERGQLVAYDAAGNKVGTYILDSGAVASVDGATRDFTVDFGTKHVSRVEFVAISYSSGKDTATASSDYSIKGLQYNLETPDTTPTPTPTPTATVVNESADVANSSFVNNNRTYTWDNNIVLQAFTNTGTLTDISRDTSIGMGVAGGKFNNQIDYSKDGSSEKIVATFKDDAGNAATATGEFTVTLGRMLTNDDGMGHNERAEIIAYNTAGQKVGDFVLDAGNAADMDGNGTRQFTLDFGSNHVAKVEFRSAAYVSGQDATSATSDYTVKGLDYHLEVTGISPAPTPSPSPTPTPTPTPTATDPNYKYTAGIQGDVKGNYDDVGVSGTITLKAGDNIQNAINNAAEGTKIILSAGTYYGQSSLSLKAGQQLIGMGDGDDVVLKGSKVYDGNGWYSSNGKWVLDNVHAADSNGYWDTNDWGSQTARLKQDLFINNQLYTRVGSMAELSKGEFYQEGTRLYLSGDNTTPKGALTEFGYYGNAFDNMGDGSVLKNFTVTQYANTHHWGAINLWYSNNVQVVDVNAVYNHGAGLNMGNGSVVQGGSYSYNGQLGIMADYQNITVKDAIIVGNNYARYTTDNEAGGIKYCPANEGGAAGTMPIVTGNYVADNYGVGIWSDCYANSSIVKDNQVIHNATQGIMIELGVANNDVTYNLSALNGWGSTDVWMWGTQIAIQTSASSDVLHNLAIVGNGYGNGIALMNSDRGDNALLTYNSNVSANTVVHLGANGQSGFEIAGVIPDTPINYTFDGNQYYLASKTAQYFAFDPNDGSVDWSQVSNNPKTLGHELNGQLSYPTDVTAYVKNLGLDAYLLPTLPTPIRGSALSETITGTNGINIISAGGGNDKIFGLDGNDVILTGTGNNTVIGGAGVDFIHLGDGNDVIYFGKTTELGDTLFHFDSREDVLDIGQVLAALGKTGSSLYLQSTGLEQTNLYIENGATDILVAKFLSPEIALKISDIHWI